MGLLEVIFYPILRCCKNEPSPEVEQPLLQENSSKDAVFEGEKRITEPEREPVSEDLPVSESARTCSVGEAYQPPSDSAELPSASSDPPVPPPVPDVVDKPPTAVPDVSEPPPPAVPDVIEPLSPALPDVIEPPRPAVPDVIEPPPPAVPDVIEPPATPVPDIVDKPSTPDVPVAEPPRQVAFNPEVKVIATPPPEPAPAALPVQEPPTVPGEVQSHIIDIPSETDTLYTDPGHMTDDMLSTDEDTAQSLLVCRDEAKQTSATTDAAVPPTAAAQDDRPESTGEEAPAPEPIASPLRKKNKSPARSGSSSGAATGAPQPSGTASGGSKNKKRNKKKGKK